MNEKKREGNYSESDKDESEEDESEVSLEAPDALTVSEGSDSSANFIFFPPVADFSTVSTSGVVF